LVIVTTECRTPATADAREAGTDGPDVAKGFEAGDPSFGSESVRSPGVRFSAPCFTLAASSDALPASDFFRSSDRRSRGKAWPLEAFSDCSQGIAGRSSGRHSKMPEPMIPAIITTPRAENAATTSPAPGLGPTSTGGEGAGSGGGFETFARGLAGFATSSPRGLICSRVRHFGQTTCRAGSVVNTRIWWLHFGHGWGEPAIRRPISCGCA